ncbi:hypothetical protein FHP25_20280 [Vineibacter terrae]|uniref:Uncharacterized protein n=1 Tax=Vineibacter terrae TaxID=2586908 RepID=A0A5C8PIV7_9HYPH|nr:hypothetical protein [Vineibacter terrae]TXL73745.1 hypothetical protein FHP25_20280 [Vineibacter terrae]
MFVIIKGPLDAHYKLTSREKMGKSFETNEDAREFLVTHLKRSFAKHDYDADTDIWWGRNTGDAHATGFHIENV